MTRIIPPLSAILALAANSVPLLGILFWQWDAFQLLMLYWMETVIVAFWTIRRIARLRPDQLGSISINGRDRPATYPMLRGFFAIHAGAFMVGHLALVWALFSREWLRHVHGFRDFVDQMFIANGIWLALLLMMLSGWISFRISAPSNARAGRMETPNLTTGGRVDSVAPIIGRLYLRIVIMQVAVIVGAMFANSYGSLAPLLIVIGLKTLVDVLVSVQGPSPKAVTVTAGKPSLGGLTTRKPLGRSRQRRR